MLGRESRLRVALRLLVHSVVRVRLTVGLFELRTSRGQLYCISSFESSGTLSTVAKHQGTMTHLTSPLPRIHLTLLLSSLLTETSEGGLLLASNPRARRSCRSSKALPVARLSRTRSCLLAHDGRSYE